MFILSLLVWARHGFDTIHSANPPDTAVLIAIFYKLFGKKYVFDHHDLAPEMYWVRFKGKGSKIVHWVLMFLEILSCRVASRVIATNESYKAMEIQRGKIRAERVTIVRNGPDLDRMSLSDPDAILGKKADVILGYVGTIGYQDGLDYLLRALNLLITELGKKDFYCVIIGKGAALPSLQELAVKLGLQEHVWFTGFIPDDDMLRYLSTADICVDPDPSNPFNDRCTMIKMMEYMALSKPIVAFDLPEHRVSAGESALYACPNEELDFARQIALLIDDADRRQKIGRAGRKRVEKVLAWPHQLKSLLEAYEMLNH
jgi:glycosyltransferase involved in cell wall biosynthesis